MSLGKLNCRFPAERTKEISMNRTTVMLVICLTGCQEQASTPSEVSATPDRMRVLRL